jgi:hypothetical protein
MGEIQVFFAVLYCQGYQMALNFCRESSCEKTMNKRIGSQVVIVSDFLILLNTNINSID